MFASAAAARWVAELAKGIPSSRLTLPFDNMVVESTIDAGLNEVNTKMHLRGNLSGFIPLRHPTLPILTVC